MGTFGPQAGTILVPPAGGGGGGGIQEITSSDGSLSVTDPTGPDTDLKVVAGGGAPSGPAGGDLGSNYPNPTVVGLRGVALSATPATSGQAYVLVGGIWVPTTVLQSLTAADLSVVVGGTATAPTIKAAPLNVIAGADPATGSVDVNTQKITSLGPGTVSSDAVRFDQIPVSANGYGITGNTGLTPTPAVGLTAVTAVLAANTAYNGATPVNFVTTSTLAAGTWLVIMRALAISTAGVREGSLAQIAGTPANVTIAGITSATVSTTVAGNVPTDGAVLPAIWTVTGAGTTAILQGVGASTSMSLLAADAQGNYAGSATGIVCVRIA